MKKRLVSGLFVALMAGLPIGVFAGQTIDSPHVNLDSNADTEDCSLCHFSAGAYVCTDCHTNSTGGYTDTSAPLVQTHGGRAPAFECQVCHNPHVSLQYGNQTALVTGQIDTVDTSVANQITFSISGVGGAWGGDPTLWVGKSYKEGASGLEQNTDRGLILWVTEGSDAYSFEVTAADASSITVKGSLPTIPTPVTISTPNSFELHMGQLIAKKVGDTIPANSTSYRDGVHDVTYPLGGTNDFVNATGANGICQVCHTSTSYWTNDGLNTSHNATSRCLDCHRHETAFLVTSCNGCHGEHNNLGVPTLVGGVSTGMAKPSTGSATAGAHETHAITYGFDCNICHTGSGMTDADPAIDKGDGINIGFNTYTGGGLGTAYDGQVGVTYVGGNGTTVVDPPTGAITCSNIYCHSNGYAAPVKDNTSGTSGAQRCPASTTSTSPKWDMTSPDPQGDTTKCNNCHNNGDYASAGYTPTLGNRKSLPGYNAHWPHAYYNLSCMYCHNDTVDNFDNTISNLSMHNNGEVNVKSGGTWGATSITYTYDPAARTCSGTIGCHVSRVWDTLNTNLYGTGDDIVCADVCSSVPPNEDPVFNYTLSFYDYNTMVITDTSTDADRIDSAKENCNGGGFDGTPGRLKIITNRPGNYVQLVPLDGSTREVYKSIMDEQKNTTAVPGSSVVFVNMSLSDNAPTSWSNAQSFAPTPGAGYVNTGWIYAVIDPALDVSSINELPVINTPLMNWVDLGGGNYEFQITDQTTDPDFNDPAKNALFGGGHDGLTQSLIKVVFSDAQVIFRFTDLTDVPSGEVISRTYNGVAPGFTAWFSLEVQDQHRRNATANTAFPTRIMYSGWYNSVIP